jgi:hypothetical protein
VWVVDANGGAYVCMCWLRGGAYVWLWLAVGEERALCLLPDSIVEKALLVTR